MRKLLNDIQRRLSWVINEMSKLKTKLTSLTTRVDVVEVVEDRYTKGVIVYPCSGIANAMTKGDVTTTANQLYLIPFFLSSKMTITKLGIHCTDTPGDNIVAGLYKYTYSSDTWTKVCQVGPFSTSTAGVQEIAISASDNGNLTQGMYATALLSDGATDNLTGYDVNNLQYTIGTFHTVAARVAYFFKYNLTYTATLPATIAGPIATGGSEGDSIAACFLVTG
tara:strand:+ start:1369 stop:2037 length:669 start_codon:yes stop_codon:yes gene_type:complete